MLPAGEGSEVHWRSSLAIAIAALGVGYVLYAVARPETHSVLLWHIAAPIAIPQALSWLFGSAPSFLHTLAFAMLLSLAVGGDRRTRVAACLLWGAVEIAAEFAQLPSAGGWMQALVPDVAHPSVVRGLLPGTFSFTDLAGVLLGAALATGSVLIPELKGESP